MDRDTDPSDPSEAVRQTKSRIAHEAENDPDHRRAVFSSGREIENDVDPNVFRKAVARLLSIDVTLLSALQLSGGKRYAEEILAHLKLDPDETKTANRKLKDKVGLAELVVDEWTDDAQIPTHIDELLDLIDRSRLA